MSNGYGFHTPGTRPSPDPRQVGQMLMMGGQAQPMGQPGMMAPQGMSPGVMADDRQPQEAPAHSQDEALRREGGKLMGGAGADNLSQAVGEALTRAGGGHVGNPNPHKNRAAHLSQLQQLGLSEMEALLLGETL